MNEETLRRSGPCLFTVTMQDGGVREDCLSSLFTAREALWYRWSDPFSCRIKSVKIRRRERSDAGGRSVALLVKGR